ncbi:MAG TPA: SGNH/GDSL hydrolase family protein [Candidatus Limnocylindrales bacterium]
MATVVCFGDSNTHGADPETGERLPPDVRWPGVLAAALGPAHRVVEEGLNGRTACHDDPTAEGRNAVGYLLPCLWSHEPLDVVVIMLGTNDLKFTSSALEIARGVDVLVGLARRSLAGPAGQPPDVLLVAPPPLGPPSERSELWGFAGAIEASRQLGRLYRVVAGEQRVAFLDAGNACTVSPLDGVHLDADAHGALGRAVAERLVARWAERAPVRTTSTGA